MTQLDEIVCVTQYRSIVFNSQLQEKSSKPILDRKFEFIEGVQNFEVAQTDFLISCQVNQAIFNEEIDNIAELGLDNQPDYNSIVFRAKRSQDNSCFVDEDLKKESMLIKQEKIENVYEYDTRKFVISLYPDDILITSGWQ